MQHLIYPSILSADLGNLKSEIGMLNVSEADAIHIDIMDGVFVPNISFGFPIVETIKKYSEKPLDIHLMITNPNLYLEKFIAAGANSLLVHYESNNSLYRTIEKIKKLGVKAGVVLNPHSPVNLIKDIIADLDVVLIMTVDPGYGGQEFINWSYRKIEELKNLIISRQANTLIQVDGGVNTNNAKRLVKSGADILVAGNFIFQASDPITVISKLKLLKT
ncbi:MAG TPA: ribulose-phosphate 3-epimerase [Bacteroidales bacterium]|nr:ribulose-phosphate 3-epimerase [Bacteroidales bacterium]